MAEAIQLALYKIADLAGPNGLLRMSRASIYRQIKAGRIRTVKQGDATFITAAAIAEYIAILEREAVEASPAIELNVPSAVSMKRDAA